MNQATARQQEFEVDQIETVKLAILGDVTLSYVIALRQSPFFYKRVDSAVGFTWTTDVGEATKFATNEAARSERRVKLGLFRAVVQAWLERPGEELVVWNEEEK